MATDKFDEFIKRNDPKELKSNVDGSFDCQVCDEYVDRAYYDREHSFLIWKCSEGHLSKLKEFSLG